MVAAPVLWSTAGVVTRHIEQAPAFEQVFWRSLFACGAVTLYLFFRRMPPLAGLRAAGWRGLFSALMWTVMFTAFVIALSLTSTANTLITISVGPLLTAFAAYLFLDERISVGTWLAAGAAAVGIGVMFGAGVDAHHLGGMAVALLIPFAAAANVINLRQSAGRIDLIPSVMLGAVLSCLVALPFTLPFTATTQDLLLLAFLGVFQLGLPCVFLVIASRTLAAPEIALLGLLEVVLGPIWAWLGAGEVPAGSTLVGGAIVLAALAANEIGAAQRKPV